LYVNVSLGAFLSL